MLAATVAACSTGNPRAEAARVVLVGDSLAQEAAPYLERLLDGMPVEELAVGGTAPCDWLDGPLPADEATVVVVSFTGNSLTECMADGRGGMLAGDALVERYRSDVTRLVDTARETGARVLLVGQPAQAEGVGSGDLVDRLNDLYRDLADGPDVDFVDAGAAVEHADGTAAERLPCLPDEPECDPSGMNVVRSADGVHFCPAVGQPGICLVYASGAHRFAAAIRDGIDGA